MITLNDVSLSYENNGPGTNVMEHIDLEVRKGECLAVVGQSGCGKTSLLNLIAGLIQPSSGVVLFKNKRMAGPSKKVSIISQTFGLFPWKTVKNNMLLPLQLRKEKADPIFIDEVVALLGLKPLLARYPAELSGGQKQRVAIGRALLNQSDVILMDEPFSALDCISRERLQVFIRSLFKDKGLTSVIVTHNIEEAVVMGERIVVFNQTGKTFAGVIDNKYHVTDEKDKAYELNRCVQLIKKLLNSEELNEATSTE